MLLVDLASPVLPRTVRTDPKGVRSHQYKVVFRSHHTLRREKLTRVKTPRPDLLKRSVVYEVPCLDCEKVYVGETKRNLKQRLMEHKGAVRREDRTNGIATHAWDKDHRVNWKRPEL